MKLTQTILQLLITFSKELQQLRESSNTENNKLNINPKKSGQKKNSHEEALLLGIEKKIRSAILVYIITQSQSNSELEQRATDCINLFFNELKGKNDLELNSTLKILINYYKNHQYLFLINIIRFITGLISTTDEIKSQLLTAGLDYILSLEKNIYLNFFSQGDIEKGLLSTAAGFDFETFKKVFVIFNQEARRVLFLRNLKEISESNISDSTKRSCLSHILSNTLFGQENITNMSSHEHEMLGSCINSLIQDGSVSSLDLLIDHPKTALLIALILSSNINQILTFIIERKDLDITVVINLFDVLLKNPNVNEKINIQELMKAIITSRVEIFEYFIVKMKKNSLPLCKIDKFPLKIKFNLTYSDHDTPEIKLNFNSSNFFAICLFMFDKEFSVELLESCLEMNLASFSEVEKEKFLFVALYKKNQLFIKYFISRNYDFIRNFSFVAFSPIKFLLSQGEFENYISTFFPESILEKKALNQVFLMKLIKELGVTSRDKHIAAIIEILSEANLKSNLYDKKELTKILCLHDDLMHFFILKSLIVEHKNELFKIIFDLRTSHNYTFSVNIPPICLNKEGLSPIYIHANIDSTLEHIAVMANNFVALNILLTYPLSSLINNSLECSPFAFSLLKSSSDNIVELLLNKTVDSLDQPLAFTTDSNFIPANLALYRSSDFILKKMLERMVQLNNKIVNIDVLIGLASINDLEINEMILSIVDLKKMAYDERLSGYITRLFMKGTSHLKLIQKTINEMISLTKEDNSKLMPVFFTQFLCTLLYYFSIVRNGANKKDEILNEIKSQARDSVAVTTPLNYGEYVIVWDDIIAVNKFLTTMIDDLLKLNVSTNIEFLIDNINFTPLALACLTRQKHWIKKLFEKGVDVNFGISKNILGIIVFKGYTETVKILLQSDIDLFRCNSRGYTPLDYAVLGDQIESANLIFEKITANLPRDIKLNNMSHLLKYVISSYKLLKPTQNVLHGLFNTYLDQNIIKKLANKENYTIPVEPLSNNSQNTIGNNYLFKFFDKQGKKNYLQINKKSIESLGDKGKQFFNNIRFNNDMGLVGYRIKRIGDNVYKMRPTGSLGDTRLFFTLAPQKHWVKEKISDTEEISVPTLNTLIKHKAHK